MTRTILVVGLSPRHKKADAERDVFLELWTQLYGPFNKSEGSVSASRIRVALLCWGGFAFWFADGVIHAVVPGTDRILVEIEAMALVVLFLVLGILAKGAEDHFEAGEVDPDGPKSLGEALRK
jgi:hypothetical protein